MNLLIREALKEYGLDEKESLVYTSALESGETTASDLSKKTSIQRELTYVILKRLESKGLISVTVKNWKKHYQSVNPLLLIEKVEEKKMILKKAIPEFNSLRNTKLSVGPTVKVFEGVEGIKSVFNSILNYKSNNSSFTTLVGYGSAGKFEDFLLWSLPHFIKKRAKAKIHFRALYNESKESIKKKRLPLSEVRFLPKEFESSTFNLIYPGHLATIIFSENPVAILIQSEEIYHSYKLYFEFLWKNAKTI